MKQQQSDRTVRLASYTEQHIYLITTALGVYAEHMREAADEAERHYRAGQDDAAVKTAQDRSMVTNNGYRQSAAMFRDCAGRAEAVLAGLAERTEDDEDGPEDGAEVNVPAITRAIRDHMTPAG